MLLYNVSYSEAVFNNEDLFSCLSSLGHACDSCKENLLALCRISDERQLPARVGLQFALVRSLIPLEEKHDSVLQMLRQ